MRGSRSDGRIGVLGDEAERLDERALARLKVGASQPEIAQMVMLLVR